MLPDVDVLRLSGFYLGKKGSKQCLWIESTGNLNKGNRNPREVFTKAINRATSCVQSGTEPEDKD